MRNLLGSVVCLAMLVVVAAAQSTEINQPEHLVIDSRDNVYVTLRYGIARIASDGTVTNLTKPETGIGDLDKSWHNLVIDSKDTLYAAERNVIYKINIGLDGKAVG